MTDKFFGLPRVCISLIEDISDTNGTTVRARAILKLLSKTYSTSIITRANSVDDQLSIGLNINRSSVTVIAPKGTKLWNVKLIPTILKSKIDVAYCSADIFGFFTFYIISKLRGFKIIFEAHALSFKERKQTSRFSSAVFFVLELFIAKKADAVISLSGETHKFYKSHNDNAHLIPVFIEPQTLPTSKKRFKKNTRTIGIIGPFDSYQNKCQLAFLNENLNKFDKRINFVAIGKSQDDKCNERITYTGRLSPSDYARTLEGLDAVLVPVDIATYGPKNKIIESMAREISVFTTIQGAVGLDFVENARDLFIVHENELVETVNRFIFDDQLLQKVGSNAAVAVEKFYSESVWSRELSSIVLRTCKSKKI